MRTQFESRNTLTTITLLVAITLLGKMAAAESEKTEQPIVESKAKAETIMDEQAEKLDLTFGLGVKSGFPVFGGKLRLKLQFPSGFLVGIDGDADTSFHSNYNLSASAFTGYRFNRHILAYVSAGVGKSHDDKEGFWGNGPGEIEAIVGKFGGGVEWTFSEMFSLGAQSGWIDDFKEPRKHSVEFDGGSSTTGWDFSGWYAQLNFTVYFGKHLSKYASQTS